MKKKILLAALALLFIGLLSLPFAFATAKIIRSHQHLTDAKEIKEEGEDRTAFFKLQSAYNLTPENDEIVRLLGPYAADVFHPRTLEWWTRAADKGMLAKDGRIELIRYGLRTGEGALVRPYLYKMEKEFGAQPELQSLRLRFLQRDRRHREAFELAGELLSNGHGGREVFSAYIHSASSAPDFGPGERREALALLQNLSQREDSLGLDALRTRLVLWDGLSPEERDALGNRLREHPAASISDRLHLLSLRLAAGKDRALGLSEAKATYEELAGREEGGDAGAVLASFTDWLMRENYLQPCLRYLETPDTAFDPALFHTRQLALMLSGSPEKAYQYSLSENPLETARNLVLRAMAQSRMKEREAVQQSLSLAVESIDESEIPWLESILLRGREVDLLAYLFEQLEKSLENPGPARVKLLAYYYVAQDEQGIERLLREVDPHRLTVDVRDKIPFLYFRTLYRVDLPATRSLIEELVTEMPDIAEFRILLSFVYTMSGKAALAGDLLQELPADLVADSRMVRIMMAAVHLANRDLPRAITLADGIAAETLLSQERTLLSELLL